MAVVSPAAPPGGPAPRPRLRGVLHLAALPLSPVAGLVLVVAMADGPGERWGGAVYALAGAVLLGVSALYHRGTWDLRTRGRLRRLATHYIAVALAVS